MLNNYIKYNNNSCYIDSVIIALFHNHTTDLFKYFVIKNNKLLNDIVLKLHISKTNFNLNNLRQIFYKKTNNINWLYEQQDVADTIDILLKILNIKETLLFNNNLYFFNFLNILSYKNNLEKKINKIIFIKYKFLFINIIRNNNGKKDYSIFNFKEKINNLNCISIIIHNGNNISSGHFTTVFKHYNKNLWYLYDDLKTKYEKIYDIYNWDNKYILKNLCALVYSS